MGVASLASVNLVSLNLVSLKMIQSVLILSTVIACITADVFTTTTSFTVKAGKTKATATCDFTITYTGDTVSKEDSKVKCSIPWPKASALASTVTKSFTVGDVAGTVLTAEVTFKLDKKKKKAASTVKTTLKSTTSVPFTADASFYPASLWCPQEEAMIPWSTRLLLTPMTSAPRGVLSLPVRVATLPASHGPSTLTLTLFLD